MIGLDISDHSVKVVRIVRKKMPVFKAYAAEKLPDGAIIHGIVEQKSAVQGAVTKALTACSVAKRSGEPIVISVPEKQSFLRVLEIPEMDDEEITEAIQWEVAQHIPFGLDTVYLDWQPLSIPGHTPPDSKIEVQVGAAQRKVIDSIFGMLQPLSLDIAAFELEAQALSRSLISKELQAKQGILIVDLGRSATNVIIHDHGALRFTATLPKGVSNITSQAPQHVAQMVVKDLSTLHEDEARLFVEALMPFMEELAAQVHGIAEFYNSIGAQHEVQEIILTGGGANMPGLDTALGKFFNKVHFQRGNPWVNIVTGKKDVKPPISAKQSVRYCVAIGLALRPNVI